MKKHNSMKTVAFASAFACALSAWAQYQGDVYYTAQDNSGYAFGNDPKFGRLVDGGMVNFNQGEIDWENCNFIMDAQYTGSTHPGTNFILAPAGEFFLKSFTVADNWNGSETYGGNKAAVWFGGTGSADKSVLNVSGALTIKSSVNYGNSADSPDAYSLTLNAGSILIDVDKNRTDRNVRFQYYNKLSTAGNFTANNGGEIQMNNIREGVSVGGDFYGDNLAFVTFKNSGSVNFVQNFTYKNSGSLDLSSIGDKKINIGGNFYAENIDGYLWFGANDVMTINGDFYAKSVTHNVEMNESALKMTGSFLVDGASTVYINNSADVGGDFTIKNAAFQSNGVSHIAIGGDFLMQSGGWNMQTSGYFKTAGDFTIDSSANMRVATGAGVNGGAASEDNASFYVGGKLYLGGYNEFFTNNDLNGGKMFVRSEGISGSQNMGFVFQNASGENVVTHVLNNKDTVEMSTAFFAYDNNGADRNAARLNFIMDGSGTQVLRVKDHSDATWKWSQKGAITVKNGAFLLGNGSATGTIINVEVYGGGKFGAVTDAASVGAFNGAVEVAGRANVNNIDIKDNGGLLVYADGTDNSVINMAGLISVENSLNIFVEGSVDEGDALTSILEWTSAYESQNKAVLDGLFADGKVNLFINGVEYNIDFWTVNSTSLDVVVGAIPEPAAIAAVLGALALVFAASRRK